MPSILEYAETEFSPLAEKPFTDVDSLLLSQFSYMNLSAFEDELKCENKIEIRELLKAERFERLMFHVRDTMRLLYAMASSPRWRNIKIGNFVEKLCDQSEEQFAAITVYLDDDHACAVFRGTDATLVGWKEDFRLAFRKPLASQEMSSVYLNQVGCKLPGAFMVCGHSKGGNLAAYAATWAETGVQRRITDIYSLDGPGFLPEVFEGDSYEQIRSRVHRILPYSSLVGMLLQNYEQYEVVKSSGIGILQHDAFTWQIEDGKFVKAVDIEAKQKRMNEALNQWIFTLPEEERQLFVETLFQVIDQTGVTTLTEFSEHWKENLKSCLKSLKNLDPETRKRIRRIIKILLEIYGNTLRGEKEK